jgi:hypothetical protein
MLPQRLDSELVGCLFTIFVEHFISLSFFA